MDGTTLQAEERDLPCNRRLIVTAIWRVNPLVTAPEGLPWKATVRNCYRFSGILRGSANGKCTHFRNGFALCCARDNQPRIDMSVAIVVWYLSLIVLFFFLLRLCCSFETQPVKRVLLQSLFFSCVFVRVPVRGCVISIVLLLPNT
jgi:hypothetical protein